MKKSLLTSGFLLGLISFTLGQVSQKKHVTPPTSLQHDNEIIALKKQELQKANEFAISPVFIPLTPELYIKPKTVDAKKIKPIKK